MFHRILVGVDDSPAAKAALERAVELVQAGHGRLGLLSSAPGPPPVASVGPTVLPVSRAQLEEQLLDWAQGNVEAAARVVPEEIPVTKLVTRGSAGRALLREARTGCWDLVIVGQAHRRWRLPLLEPVGERLNRRSPTPVLVVHEDPFEPLRARRRWWRRRGRTQVRTA